jgi:hypothetical protein
MNILTWFRSVTSRCTKGRKSPSSTTKAHQTKLAVETLENRMLPSAASTALVQGMYQDLLHRPADPGSAGFVAQLDKGVSASVVALEIETAPGNEYRIDLVARDYATLLKRPGSPAEWSGWANQLAAGATDQQVAAMIAGSAEYFALHGNTTAGFLNGLYVDALGRPHTENAFVDAVNQGVPRQTVAYEVFTSAEASYDQVLADYQQFLGRSGVGDPGTTAFTAQLVSGTSHEAVLAELVGSPEYQARYVPALSINAPGGQPDTSPSSDSSGSVDQTPVIVIPPPVNYTPYDPGTPVDTYTPPADTGSSDTGWYDDSGCGCSSDPGTYDTSGGDGGDDSGGY